MQVIIFFRDDVYKMTCYADTLSYINAFLYAILHDA